MKRTSVLLLLCIVAACRDNLAPPVPSQVKAVSPRDASVVTPSGVTYTAIDLGTFGGRMSASLRINEAGVVVGLAAIPGETWHAFRWESGVMTDLGTLGGSYSEPTGINSSGLITGYSYLPGDEHYAAVLWSGNSTINIGAPEGTADPFLIGLTDQGLVFGVAYDANGTVPFTWQGGTFTKLETLGSSDAVPWAANNNGDVVGYGTLPEPGAGVHAIRWRNGVATDLSEAGAFDLPVAVNDAGVIAGFSGNHAARWDNNGVMTDLGSLGGLSQAFAINKRGDIVGYSYFRDSAPIGEDLFAHAVVWRNGEMIDLGTLPGHEQSYAYSINDSGQVAGVSFAGLGGGAHAFLWENGVMTDLGTAGGAQSYPSDLFGINNRGQIVGASTTASDPSRTHAVLWQPTDPVLAIRIDIQPGSSANSINLSGSGNIPVAILSVSGFDATTVDPSTVRFGPGNATESHGTGHVADVNGDGVADMVLHFRTQASGIACGAASVSLTGKTRTGKQIKGSDSIATTGCH